VFFAHVRAATLGATSRANCHPFVVGRWTFMHNGQIGGFEKMRRGLERGLSDTTYDARQGTTDSELFFLLMLDEDLEVDPFAATQAGVARVLAAAEDTGIEPQIRLTAAFTDGDRVHAVRYATDAFAPTLYTGQFCGTAGRCLVSEPLDREGAAWQAVPPGSFVTMTRQAVTIRPFTV
jgi:predicted glutamine amidotransferase